MSGLESAMNGSCGGRKYFWVLWVGAVGVGAGGLGLWVRGVAWGVRRWNLRTSLGYLRTAEVIPQALRG